MRIYISLVRRTNCRYLAGDLSAYCFGFFKTFFYKLTVRPLKATKVWLGDQVTHWPGLKNLLVEFSGPTSALSCVNECVEPFLDDIRLFGGFDDTN